MNLAYKTLTKAEYFVLNKIARKTKCDCWFCIKQHSSGTDYIFDLEEEKMLSLRAGTRQLCEAIDCQENFDNCNLTDSEKLVFRSLLSKLILKFDIDWKMGS